MPRRPKKDTSDATSGNNGDVSPPPLRLEWRSPSELAENPANWRTHPPQQITALTDAIADVGWAGACLYNERTGRLIDGHARKKVALEQGTDKIPVLIGSWTEAQEKVILATLDPLAALAEADSAKLDALLREVQTSSEAVAGMLTELAQANGVVVKETEQSDTSPQLEGLQYRVIAECADETQQAELIERLEGEGYKCQPLIS